MFKLESENLTGLGAPMGKERTWINWTKYFKSIENAKKYAQNHFGMVITWKKRSKNHISSGDLGYVMFHITKIETED